MKKVYCSYCKYCYKLDFRDANIYKCSNQNTNIVENTYYSIKLIDNLCSKINKENNCKYFEERMHHVIEVKLRPESLPYYNIKSFSSKDKASEYLRKQHFLYYPRYNFQKPTLAYYYFYGKRSENEINGEFNFKNMKWGK